jgi:hypothetical protein
MNIQIKADFKKLENFIKLLGSKRYIDIGILGQESYENGISIAGIGAVMEFGSISKNIPERSFILMPIETKQKEIEKQIEPKFPLLINENSTDKFLKEMGIACEGVIQEAFDTKGFNTWQPIKEATKKAKGGSDAILIDTGELRKAISSRIGGN